MGAKMTKPALDVGLVTANAQPLLDFYEGVAGFKILDPLELPNIGTIHKMACGEFAEGLVIGKPIDGVESCELPLFVRIGRPNWIDLR